MELILVVDDEQNIVDLIEMCLEAEGFSVEKSLTGQDALEKFKSLNPDLVVLDIMLPDIDGWEICRTIRKESKMPIIMLTAREDETDRVVGLEIGADDYITKPFSPRELVARVKTVLRRTKPKDRQDKESLIKCDGLIIDLDKREVKLDGKPVDLTAKEFELLKLLASNPRMVFSRDHLLERIWSYDFYGGTRTVDVHIRHLRKKLNEDRKEPRFIETVRGVGYKFKGSKDV